jgi:SAM-dependent methyltransferase
MVDRVECVRCGAALAEPGRCSACGTSDPMLANTRVSMAAPEATIRSWREGFGIMLAQQRRQLEKLSGARAGAFEASAPRLDAMAEAIAGQVNSLTELFERMELPALPPPRSAPSFNPHMGYVQLLRDWAWPDDVQNANAVTAMRERHDGAWGEVLVLGAGAGGLAAQLHAATDAKETVALDINPLPLLLFDRLVAGEDVKVWEFPAYPKEPGRWAVPHRLRKPTRTDGLVTWLADALALPFAAGSFDVVVTHWFLDRIGRDPATVASLVHRILRPGGVWINRGPLLYEGSRDWFGRPDMAEVITWVKALGFEGAEPGAEMVDYLNSPWSTQRRQEEVYTFAATRPGSVPWLDDDAVGVPKDFASSIVQTKDPITAWCAKQLDGSRSIATLAAEIGERTKMPYAGAREGVHERLHRAWARA